MNAEASSLYGVSSYENLGEAEKIIVRNNVEGSNWTRDLTVNQSKSDGTSTLEINHKENWRRLNIYKLGEVVEHEEGGFFESIISDNVNHSPTNSGTDYWRELGSAYDIEEKIKLNVSGVKNSFITRHLMVSYFRIKQVLLLMLKTFLLRVKHLNIKLLMIQR